MDSVDVSELSAIIDEEQTQALLLNVLDDKTHLNHYYDIDEEFDAIRSIN